MKIQFLPDGAVHFTRSPEALALFEGHPKRIERMTEILFDEKKQRYFIKFLKGPCVGEILAEGYPYDHPDAVPTVEGRSTVTRRTPPLCSTRMSKPLWQSFVQSINCVRAGT